MSRISAPSVNSAAASRPLGRGRRSRFQQGLGPGRGAGRGGRGRARRRRRLADEARARPLETAAWIVTGVAGQPRATWRRKAHLRSLLSTRVTVRPCPARRSRRRGRESRRRTRDRARSRAPRQGEELERVGDMAGPDLIERAGADEVLDRSASGASSDARRRACRLFHVKHRKARRASANRGRSQAGSRSRSLQPRPVPARVRRQKGDGRGRDPLDPRRLAEGSRPDAVELRRESRSTGRAAAEVEPSSSGQPRPAEKRRCRPPADRDTPRRSHPSRAAPRRSRRNAPSSGQMRGKLVQPMFG